MKLGPPGKEEEVRNLGEEEEEVDRAMNTARSERYSWEAILIIQSSST